ncbi:MAG TPA: hypothetical protein O0X39_01935 [Methanocorpusculum sp.]|nr:hypothetical protein [Methanocorpusculum sp.]
MDISPLLFCLARLRTAAARFTECSRAEAYALAESGDNAASLKADGEADQLDNLTYDITDLIDRLAAAFDEDAACLAKIEEEAASYAPAKEFRACFAEFAGELDKEIEELSGVGAADDICEDLAGLCFMVRAISRRK